MSIEPSAEIIPFLRKDNSVTMPRDEFVEAIHLWRQTRAVADSLSRSEIGALQGGHRISTLMKSAIYMAAEYYRKHRYADVAPGVAMVIAAMCDNDKGEATLSQERMAKLFGRSRTAIAEAQARLREDGLVHTTRGRFAASNPIVPRALSRNYNHTVWLLDAICTQDASVNCQAALGNCQLPSEALQLSQLPVEPCQLETVNCQVPPVSIAKQDLHNFTKENSEERKGPPKQNGFGKMAAAVAASITTAVLPVAAAAQHPVEQVQQTVAECWQTVKARHEAGTSIHEMRSQKQVWMTPLGVLEVSGEFKAALDNDYPLVTLREGLDIAATSVRIGEGAIRAMQAIRRQFSYLQRDAAERQKRTNLYKKPEPKRAGRDPLDMSDIPLTKPRPANEVQT